MQVPSICASNHHTEVAETPRAEEGVSVRGLRADHEALHRLSRSGEVSFTVSQFAEFVAEAQ